MGITIYKNFEQQMQQFFTDPQTLKDFEDAKYKLVFAKKLLIDNLDCKKINQYDLECMTFKMILGWAKLDYKEFKNSCSIKNLSEMHIKNLYAAIAEHAPEDLKRQCGYLTQQIVLASVFPEEFNRDFKPFNAKDLFVCKGDLKSSMVRNCKVDLSHILDETPAGSSSGCGKASKVPLDEWLWSIIDDFLTQYQEIPEDRYDLKMETLCILEQAYLKGELKSGMFEIVRERCCSNTMIDYYMMFAPKDKDGNLLMDQKYQKMYIDIRNKYFTPDPLIDLMTTMKNEYDAKLELLGQIRDAAADLER